MKRETEKPSGEADPSGTEDQAGAEKTDGPDRLADAGTTSGSADAQKSATGNIQNGGRDQTDQRRGEIGDSHMGLQARLMSQALRKLAGITNKTKCTVIFINQLREKIGVMFGNPETTTGGNALKFYASVRLDIRRATQLKDGEDVIGNQVRVKVVKNKVAPPFRKAEFDIMFGEGISRSGEIIDLGSELGIIKKSGSWYSYNDTKLGQGRDAAKVCIQDNPELAEELEGLIFAALKDKE